MVKEKPESSMIVRLLREGGRFFLYAVIIALAVQAVVMEAVPGHTGDDLYNESSIVEGLEIACLAIGILLLMKKAKDCDKDRSLSVLLMGMLAVGWIREQDMFLDGFVFDGAWQVFVSLALILLGIHFFRKREEIDKSLVVFMEDRSFGILLSGFLGVFIFSRLFGRSSFWEAVMGDNYLRSVKNVAEEGSELLGYTLMMIAFIDWLRPVYQKRRSQDDA